MWRRAGTCKAAGTDSAFTALAEEAEAERLRKAKGKDKAVEPAEDGEEDEDEDDEDVVRLRAVSRKTVMTPVSVSVQVVQGVPVKHMQRVPGWSAPASATPPYVRTTCRCPGLAC